MGKLTYAETWEALEALTLIYFVQMDQIMKGGNFMTPNETTVFGEATGMNFDMRVVFTPKKEVR